MPGRFRRPDFGTSANSRAVTPAPGGPAYRRDKPEAPQARAPPITSVASSPKRRSVAAARLDWYPLVADQNPRLHASIAAAGVRRSRLARADRNTASTVVG